MGTGADRMVIFDCDGVLVDSERLAIKIDVRSLAELGWEITEDEAIDRFLGRAPADNLRVIETYLGRRVPDDWEERWGREFERVYSEELVPVPGVAQAVADLQAEGYAACVASSGGHQGIRRNLSTTGLRDLFGESIFSATDVLRGKPAPDLFEHAARSMGFAAGRCCVVEDSQYGVAGALAAGMRVVGFAGGVTPAHHLAKADRVIVEMAALPGAIGKLLA